jgi:hypothetical protein
VRRIGEDYETILRGIVSQSDDGINVLNEILADFAKRRHRIEKKQLNEINLQDLNKAQRADPLYSMED